MVNTEWSAIERRVLRAYHTVRYKAVLASYELIEDLERRVRFYLKIPDRRPLHLQQLDLETGRRSSQAGLSSLLVLRPLLLPKAIQLDGPMPLGLGVLESYIEQHLLAYQIVTVRLARLVRAH